jgi:ATP-dependent helicase/DNAse subunit B
MRLSKSKIYTFEKCPFYYKLTYLDDAIKDDKSEPMQRGVEIHKLAEDFFKPENKTPENLIKEIQKHPLYEKHKEAVINIVKFNNRMGFRMPLFREEILVEPELNIKGVIDRVDLDDKGNYILLDYKSGKKHPLSDYRFELALYTYLFEMTHNQKITHWGIYFIDADSEVIEKRDQQEIIKAIEKVKDIRRKIKERMESNKFEKTPGWLCMYCPAVKEGLCGGCKDE